MMKYLLLIVFTVVVWWLWRKSRLAGSSDASRSVARPQPAPSEAENMVKCAHCGVNQPVSDSLPVDGRYYCSAAHRRAAELEGR